MTVKYDMEFSLEVLEKNVTRLINQLWKLIPMREHGENWKKQIDTVIIEITGMNQLLSVSSKGFQLLCKLEGMSSIEDMSFDLYRKTVFECISLLQEIKNEL